jgi:hypothetical protein
MKDVPDELLSAFEALACDHFDEKIIKPCRLRHEAGAGCNITCLAQRMSPTRFFKKALRENLEALLLYGPRMSYRPTTLEAMAALSILNDTIWKEKPHVPRTEEEA